jgi:hypothetical protein
MKFFKLPHLASVVWNKDADRALAIFHDGECETEDPKVIKVLTEMGYPSEGEPPKGIKINAPKKTFKKIEQPSAQPNTNDESFDQDDVSPSG